MPDNPLSLKSLFAASDSFGTSLLAAAVDAFGTGYAKKDQGGVFTWTPECLHLEIKQEFGVDMNPYNFGKLLAAIHVMTSDDFYKRLPIFIILVNGFNGDGIDPSQFSKPDPLECGWAMTEAMLLHPPEEEEEPYCKEIRYFLGKLCDDYGIRNPPDLLRLALRDTPSGSADYSDLAIGDPTMFAGEFQSQQQTSDDIKAELQDRLQALIDQLQALRLNHGDTRNLLQKLQKR